MVKSKKSNGPIFIVGMNGSGTTMLADCLNNHPEIFIPRFESKVIPYYYFKRAEYGDLNDKTKFSILLNEFSNTHIFRNLNKGNVLIPYDHNSIENKNLACAIDLTFSFFAQKMGKFIWGDHSPKYGIYMNILVDLFPDCKIIHMIRDVRDCALSLKRRFNANVSRTAFQWKKIIQAGCRDGAVLGPKRYFEIRYEEITTDPERCMTFLFEFLEMPFDQNVLSSKMPMFEKNDGAKDIVKTLVPNSGKWQYGLSDWEIRKIEKIAGRTAAKLGYEIKYYDGDIDLSAKRIFWLRILGFFNGFFLIVRRAKISKMFQRLYRSGLSSLKQKKYFKY